MIDSIAIIVFWNKSNGVQAKLSFHPHLKHVNFLHFDGESTHFMDFDRNGFMIRNIKSKSHQKLIEGLKKNQKVEAIVCVSIKERFWAPWTPWLVRSCNEITRYGIGIDLGFTLNPVHFYAKLLQYRHSRNYEILTHWRRKHGILRRRWWWRQSS